MPGISSGRSAGVFDRSKNVAVKERPHPEYSAEGIPVGTFTLQPTLKTSLRYSDNIFGQIESDNTTGAAATSTVLLVVALVALLGLALAQRWGARRG